MYIMYIFIFNYKTLGYSLAGPQLEVCSICGAQGPHFIGKCILIF